MILEKLYPDLSTYSLYIAGNDDFVENCIKKAHELKAKQERIHCEKFVSVTPPSS